MVYVIKSREIFSHSDGKTYTSTREYEKSLHSRGQDVMEDRTCKMLIEKCRDEAKTVRKKPDDFNHVHIDFANGRVEKSKRNLNE